MHAPEFVPTARSVRRVLGLGWNVRGSKRPRYGPSLLSDQTFEHNRWRGVWLWIDPVHEVVGVYLSLTAGVHIRHLRQTLAE